jgi:hypothetical protein
VLRKIVEGIRVKTLEQLHYVLYSHGWITIFAEIQNIDDREHESKSDEEEHVFDVAWSADETPAERLILEFK